MPIPNLVANSSKVTGTPDPEIGMGVTDYLACDRTPWTVIEILSPKRIVVQRDTVVADKTKTGGMGHQNWIITPNPDGATRTISKRKDGKWRTVGQPSGYGGMIVGERDYYYCWEY